MTHQNQSILHMGAQNTGSVVYMSRQGRSAAEERSKLSRQVDKQASRRRARTARRRRAAFTRRELLDVMLFQPKSDVTRYIASRISLRRDPVPPLWSTMLVGLALVLHLSHSIWLTASGQALRKRSAAASNSKAWHGMAMHSTARFTQQFGHSRTNGQLHSQAEECGATKYKCCNALSLR